MSVSVYDFKVRSNKGEMINLGVYRGRVLLIVNVASRCGFTPQYQALQEVFTRYSAAGLMVIGFPCNQFGAQEPGSDEEIKSFCETNFDIGFPLMAKIDVNGKNANPLFAWLKDQAPGALGSRAIKWNFTKFLVDAKGETVERFAPVTSPLSMTHSIESLINSAR